MKDGGEKMKEGKIKKPTNEQMKERSVKVDKI
jgi:hypothetical protein